MNEVLKEFLEKCCDGRPANPTPFVDAAFLYDEYQQYAKTRPQPVVTKKEFVQAMDELFPSSGLLKIGPHPHFVGISYKQWRK